MCNRHVAHLIADYEATRLDRDVDAAVAVESNRRRSLLQRVLG